LEFAVPLYLMQMNLFRACLLWGFLGLAAAAVAQEGVPAAAAAPEPGVAHVVQSGETLFGLARRYGVTVGDLEAANGLRPGNVLRIGTRLRVPGADPVTTPSTPAPVAGPTPVAGDAGGHAAHVVKPGETLGKVAKSYGVTAEALARVNGIADPDRIRVGQRLRLPTPGEEPGTAPVMATSSSGPPSAAETREEAPPKAAAAPQKASSGGPVGQAQPEETYHYYDVQPNDSLSSVAAMFFTTAEEVARLNNIPATALLKAGQQLVVPTRRYFEALRRQGDMG